MESMYMSVSEYSVGVYVFDHIINLHVIEGIKQ